MDDLPQGYEVAFTATSRDECLEMRLVLIAMGIHAQSWPRDHGWVLLVKHADLTLATKEIESYRSENTVSISGQPSVANQQSSIDGGAGAGVFVYAATLLLIMVLADQRLFGLDWVEAGQMQAGPVRAGELWRTITALTLHLDVGHLLSNLLFGAVFGFLVGRNYGGGMAWLAIVTAGAVGNLLNALVQPSAHTSIGASTAVFAALGLLVSHSLKTWRSVEYQSHNRLKRWSPLVGGALLFAFLGIGGEHTDVLAHVTGLLAGCGVGWILDTSVASRGVQWLAGIGTIAVIVVAWAVAI